MPIPTPTTRPRPRRFRAALALVMALATLGLAACGDDDGDSGADGSSGSGGAAITIGHQDFGESAIVARIYGQVLAANGFDVEYQAFKDRDSIYTALESGDIDLVPEYAASGLEYLNDNAGEASPDIMATKTKLDERLADRGFASATASKAVDTNSLVVTKATAEDKGLSKISDLTTDLRLGGPQDCPTNASCIPALTATYGLDFTNSFTPLDLGGPLTKKALENGDIDVAVLFSTDAGIAAQDWTVLEDDKGIFNADNILPVAATTFVTENAALLDKVSAALTTENVTAMNKRFDIDKEDADDIASDFVEENQLG